MIYPYFTNDQLAPLLIAALILLSSILTFHLDKKRIPLILLFLGSLALGLFIANLDPFLIIWDEQYHALVAKHLVENPLKPTLYPIPLLDYDYKNWAGNYIWLHKQPLFLWQMALSLKLFGFNELAVRLPSVLLHAIASILIYRIGKISYSEKVGYYGALFFACAYYPLELVAGKYATDHNDLSFLFYITASFWAWFEYQHSGKKYWIIFIGLFSGCAILVKWLVGLLVFAVWGITIVLNEKKEASKWASISPLIISFFITLLVFIPWQLYIINVFPQESLYEYQFNTRHFFETLENHEGDMWFHLKAIHNIYGSGYAVPYIYLLGLIIWIKNANSRIYQVAIFSPIIIIYFFYSMAATKMVSFCIIVSPFLFLFFGALIDVIIIKCTEKIEHNLVKRSIAVVSIVITCCFLIDFPKIQKHHTDWNPNDNCNREAELKLMANIKNLPGLLGNDKYVVFLATDRINSNIPLMFYTDYVAYDFIPNQKQIERIKTQSWKIAILDSGNLPDFIRRDENIIKIKWR